MAIPVTRDSAPQWRALSAEGKRERVLAVAGPLFAERGIDVPMPDLAHAVGVGVGSLYRQFETKQDVITALVLKRADEIERLAAAAVGADDAYAALGAFMRAVVSQQIADQVAQEAWSYAQDHPDVVAARARIAARIAELVSRGHAQRALRADVSADDVGYVLAGSRRAELIGPGGASRVVELALAGMAA